MSLIILDDNDSIMRSLAALQLDRIDQKPVSEMDRTDLILALTDAVRAGRELLKITGD